MQTPPGLAPYCCQQPREATWALPALQKAPGTLHHHTMFSDREIVPWACCAETASPQIGVVSSSSPKLSCPGPPWRRLCLKQDHHAASLPLQSVCVARPCGSTHTSHRDCWWNSSEQRSRCCGEDAGETRILLLWEGEEGTDTPHDSCGNHLLRTLSADLANTQLHPFCTSRFPSSFCLPCLGGPKPHPSAGQGWGVRDCWENSWSRSLTCFFWSPDLGCRVGFRCWASLARPCSGCSSADPWRVHLLPPCRGPGVSSPSPKNWGLRT